MRILVTGAGGFIGSAVVKALKSSDNEVTGIVFKNRIKESEIPIVTADLTEIGSLSNVGHEFDAIVNCAGLAHQSFQTADKLFYGVNVETVRNLAKFAFEAKVKHFIHLSSISVYGNTDYDGWVNESAVCQPEGAYAKSKLESEKVCQEIFNGSSTGLTILRPATVIGEGDPGNILKLIKLIDSGKFKMIGKGNNRKSFVYIGDLAKAVCALVNRPRVIQSILNVSAEPVTVNVTVNTIGDALGKRIGHIGLSAEFASKTLSVLSRVTGSGRLKGLNVSLQKWMRDDAIDARLLHELFVPEISAEAALRREVSWFRSRYD